MPLTDSILNLANTTITITHRTESPRLLGRTQPPTTVVVSAKASVQPTSRGRICRDSPRVGTPRDRYLHLERSRSSYWGTWGGHPARFGPLQRVDLRGRARRTVDQPPGRDLLLRRRPKGCVLMSASWSSKSRMRSSLGR